MLFQECKLLRNAHGISLAQLAKYFCSYSTNTWMCVGRTMQEQLSRLSNRSIAGYATIAITKKTGKKTSQLFKLFHARSLHSLFKKTRHIVPGFYLIA